MIKRLSGPVHPAPGEFENATITHHFGFAFEENHMFIVTTMLSKSFSIHMKMKNRRFKIPLL